MLINTWINIIHNEPIKHDCQDISSVCLVQDNLFSFEQEITPLYHQQHEQTHWKHICCSKAIVL